MLIIPVVQGRSAGIDAYTAICRALGILPGSPARGQASDRTPPTPVSQVVWTPALLQVLADARPERGLAKAQEVCVACHGEQGVSASPEYPHLAGQSGAAIYKQLNDYRTGSRTQSADDATSPRRWRSQHRRRGGVLRRAAASAIPNPATPRRTRRAAIVRLVELGDPSRSIPPCAACHRPGAGGPDRDPDPVRATDASTWSQQLEDAMPPASAATTSMRRMRAIAAKLTAGRDRRAGADITGAGFR